MGKQLDMFPSSPPEPRPQGMIAELVQAHRDAARRGGKKRGGRIALCPKCGTSIELSR